MTCGFLIEKQWRKLSEIDTFPENIITDKVCKGTVLWIGHALFYDRRFTWKLATVRPLKGKKSIKISIYTYYTITLSSFTYNSLSRTYLNSVLNGPRSYLNIFSFVFFSKELSFFHKLKFFHPNIFSIWWCKP